MKVGSRVVAADRAVGWDVKPGTVGTIIRLGILPGLYVVQWDDDRQTDACDGGVRVATEEDEDAYYKRLEDEDRRSHPVFGW
jgi:hypothetical protein